MKFLLISDLDNTWIGDNKATIALNQKLLSMRDRFYLVYATGRSFASVTQLMRDFWLLTGEKLLEPDYLITGVGSEIYHQGIIDYAWAERISQGWDRQTLVSIAQHFPQLIMQLETEQNPWKLSFCKHPLADSSVVAALENQIRQAGLQANVIFSSSRDLDILPVNTDKGIASMYLRQMLDIPLEATLVCGDSGNDLSMFQQGSLGVIVNNAQPELLNWYNKQKRTNCYFARSSYALAILEALSHFGLMV